MEKESHTPLLAQPPIAGLWGRREAGVLWWWARGAADLVYGVFGRGFGQGIAEDGAGIAAAARVFLLRSVDSCRFMGL